MDCIACSHKKICRTNETCQSVTFETEKVIQKYSNDKEIINAASELVDNGKAGTLSRLQEIIQFAETMNYRRIGLAYCYGMEKKVNQIVQFMRKSNLSVVPVSCTVGGISQNKVNSESSISSVSCNPIGQASQLNNEKVDFTVTIGLCLGHDILFQREIEADFTNLVVKDRVYNNAPLAQFNA